MPNRIVTSVYRPKRPPRKRRKAVAITGPAIEGRRRHRPRDIKPAPPAVKPAIGVTRGAVSLRHWRRYYIGSLPCRSVSSSTRSATAVAAVRLEKRSRSPALKRRPAAALCGALRCGRREGACTGTSAEHGRRAQWSTRHAVPVAPEASTLPRLLRIVSRRP